MTIRKGRPLRGDAKRVRLSFTLHPREAGWLKESASAAKTSQSEFLEKLIFQAQSEFKTTPQLGIPIPREKVVKFCQDHHIKRISLFGSALRSDFGPESDIDLLVEFQPGAEPGLFELTRLESELSRIFNGKKIDLKTPSELSRYFRSQVMEEAKVLYAA